MRSKEAIKELDKEISILVLSLHSMYFYMLTRKNLIADAQRIIEEKPKPFVKWVGGKKATPQAVSFNESLPSRKI